MVHYEFGSDLDIGLEHLLAIRAFLDRYGRTVCDLEMQRFKIQSDYINKIRYIISIQCSGSVDSRLEIAIGRNLNNDELTLDVVYLEGEKELRYNNTRRPPNKGKVYVSRGLDRIIDYGYLRNKLRVLLKALEEICESISESPKHKRYIPRYKSCQKILEILKNSIRDETYRKAISKIQREGYINIDPSIF